MQATDQETGVDDSLDDLANAIGEHDEAQGSADTAEPQATDDPDAETDDATEDTTDAVEFDGKKLQIPKGTPPELVESVKQLANDLKADYTRKTQDVAASRKEVNARTEAVEQQEKLLTANFQRAVALKTVQDKLSQFDGIDWQSLADANPTQATKLNLAYQQTQREAQKLHADWQAGLNQTRNLSAQTAAQAQEQQAAAARDCAQWCETNIKGFNPTMLKGIDANARTYGYSSEELSGVNDSRLMKVLHDAYQWQKLQKESPQTLRKVASAPRALTPAAAQTRPGNKAAFERLKTGGRIEDLAALL